MLVSPFRVRVQAVSFVLTALMFAGCVMVLCGPEVWDPELGSTASDKERGGLLRPCGSEVRDPELHSASRITGF
ncbi:MAG: hypothetical protein EDS66_01790 [Planctomycetota bacterium]|nr:MAG: hypothetical protein EDS66_01790 [Planctomycetota bacterium]MCQ3920609.1 hypothetical protein [Planctomycetota bacterium]